MTKTFTLNEDSVEYQTIINSLYGYSIGLEADLKHEKDSSVIEEATVQLEYVKKTLEFLGMDY